MSLPIAAAGAVVAALLETSVLTEVKIAGAQPDLVLVLAVVVTMVLGPEDGLVWAFLGGLMLDLLLPGRPAGATTLALLVAVGLSVLLARIGGPSRQVVVILSVVALSFLYHGLVLATLALTSGVGIAPLPIGAFLSAALLNAVVTAVTLIVLRALLLRFGSPEREW